MDRYQLPYDDYLYHDITVSKLIQLADRRTGTQQIYRWTIRRGVER